MLMRYAFIFATAASLLLIPWAGVAQTFTSFPVGTGTIGGITAGPDGNLWFTETTANRIGRITPAGMIDVFPLPTSAAQPQRICAGADGNLWFTETAAIGRISVTGVVTEFPIPVTGFRDTPVSIASGPDGTSGSH